MRRRRRAAPHRRGDGRMRPAGPVEMDRPLKFSGGGRRPAVDLDLSEHVADRNPARGGARLGMPLQLGPDVLGHEPPRPSSATVHRRPDGAPSRRPDARTADRKRARPDLHRGREREFELCFLNYGSRSNLPVLSSSQLRPCNSQPKQASYKNVSQTILLTKSLQKKRFARLVKRFNRHQQRPEQIFAIRSVSTCAAHHGAYC